MAWQEIFELSLHLFLLLATLGRGRGCRLPGLLALFAAIYQAPLPALLSLIHSFVPATALKRICSGSDSIPLLQGCLLPGPLGDLASLSTDWALSALPSVLPGLCGAQPSPLQRCYACFCCISLRLEAALTSGCGNTCARAWSCLGAAPGAGLGGGMLPSHPEKMQPALSHAGCPAWARQVPGE